MKDNDYVASVLVAILTNGLYTINEFDKVVDYFKEEYELDIEIYSMFDYHDEHDNHYYSFTINSYWYNTNLIDPSFKNTFTTKKALELTFANTNIDIIRNIAIKVACIYVLKCIYHIYEVDFDNPLFSKYANINTLGKYTNTNYNDRIKSIINNVSKKNRLLVNALISVL